MFYFNDVYGFNINGEIVRFEKGINAVPEEIQKHHFFKELLGTGFVVPAEQMPVVAQSKEAAELLSELEAELQKNEVLTAKVSELEAALVPGKNFAQCEGCPAFNAADKKTKKAVAALFAPEE